LDKQTKRSQQHQARLAALADKTQRERAELKRNELDKKSVEELNRVDEMNSKTSTLLERYGESVQDFETRARESLEKAKNAADLFTKTLQASNSAKANLHTVSFFHLFIETLFL
jgi:replicative DNA helicase